MIHAKQTFQGTEIAAILAEAEQFASPRKSPERVLDARSPAKRLALMMSTISNTILPRQLQFTVGAGLVRFSVRNGGILLHNDGARTSDLRDLAVMLARLAGMTEPLTVSATHDASDMAADDISCPVSDLRAIAEAALADLGVQTDLAALGLYDQLPSAAVRAEFDPQGGQIRMQGAAALLPGANLAALLKDLVGMDADLPDQSEDATLILLGSAVPGDVQMVLGHSSEGTVLAVIDGAALTDLLPVWGAIAPSDFD